jgi:hypothetical protein
MRECVICENRAHSQLVCYLCRGLGITTLRTFNRYKRGEIKKDEWLRSTGTPAALARGDWITVTLTGGPHRGTQMVWPADQPPQVGQELAVPVEADLAERASRQEPLFHESASYVIEHGPRGLRAVYLPPSRTDG